MQKKLVTLSLIVVFAALAGCDDKYESSCGDGVIQSHEVCDGSNLAGQSCTDYEGYTGGEDKDFFRRLAEAGHTFTWCDEAPVFESVPASRLTRKYMLQRALLRGRNSLRLGGNRLASLAKSAIAIPSYALLMPLALLRGQDHFMHLLIRFCDHSGKLLATLGLNPVRERQM